MLQEDPNNPMGGEGHEGGTGGDMPAPAAPVGGESGGWSPTPATPAEGGMGGDMPAPATPEVEMPAEGGDAGHGEEGHEHEGGMGGGMPQ